MINGTRCVNDGPLNLRHAGHEPALSQFWPERTARSHAMCSVFRPGPAATGVPYHAI